MITKIHSFISIEIKQRNDTKKATFNDLPKDKLYIILPPLSNIRVR